jgi:hypothetical protein
MHDSGAAFAEPDDAPLRRIGAASSSQAGAPLPELLDTRLVRVELTRLRRPRQGFEGAGLGVALIARSRGAVHAGRPD